MKIDNVISPVSNLNPQTERIGGKPAAGLGFGEILQKQMPEAAKPQAPLNQDSSGVKFSQHALERIRSRGISMDTQKLAKLNEAIIKAAQKGSKESLILMDDSALIVSVKNKTVITAMDREAMKENVFTNIDSTIIL